MMHSMKLEEEICFVIPSPPFCNLLIVCVRIPFPIGSKELDFSNDASDPVGRPWECERKGKLEAPGA